jgi:glycosyltransferase involved in cell wall biosynthesis
VRRLLRPSRRIGGLVKLELDVHAAKRQRRGDLAIFHMFAPAPSGGGNQFLHALERELEGRGIVIEHNAISASTRACLFNSFNFDLRRLQRFARTGVRAVHRVDGPVGAYRGFDDGTDDRIATINRLAAATIFQSHWSLEKHRELGYDFAEPFVILNAPDPRIFNAEGRTPFARGRRVRVIASSWSDNPRKGGATYRYLADTLDPDRYELLFVGRSREPLPNALPPVGSEELASLLRRQDVFIAASYDDPCSNSVLEALACGLPVVYRRSGGHPELVGEAGLGFDDDDEIPFLLDRLVDQYEPRQAAIAVPALADVASAYLDVLALNA